MTISSANKPGLNADTLRKMLYFLKLTREAENRIENVLYRQGKIVGGVYVSRGKEAIGVGAAFNLQAGDVTLPCHRDFSVYMIRGLSLTDMIANWLARADSPTRGRENTVHIGDMKRGMIPIISPLGATAPVACGVALVLKQRGQGNVAMVHFGEGTSSLGNIHESMNFAAVKKLPLIFICNNNQFAYSTPVDLQFAVKSLAVRGSAYGMPGESVDGTDVLAVHEVVARAVARARAGEGPSFIECVTLRLAGHSAHDAAEYVPEKLKQEWAEKDPIQNFERLLLSQNIVSREQLEELDKQIGGEVDGAIAEADARPMPNGEDALKGVYCEPNCWWKQA